MPLVTDYTQVKETYQEAAELGIALPLFCAEDRETLEAILASALDIGREIGVENVPIVPAWTARYPSRAQITLLTACGDPVLGTRLMFSDLEHFCSPDSPYGKLRVMPHLDHAFPWVDGDFLDDFADQFASVMFDASERPFDENVKLTAQYVDRARGRVLVEGGADEVYEAGSGAVVNEPTTPEQAERFVRETGVDLVVPNVGTEHRAMAQDVRYRSDCARAISAAIGRIMVLHGSSSLGPADLALLTDDGFVKINIFTTLAVHGGQALARKVLDSLGGILPEDELKELVARGILGEAVLSASDGESLPGPVTWSRAFACSGALKMS